MIQGSRTKSQVRNTNFETANFSRVETAVYVEQMSRELAHLAKSAGLDGLANLLILASLEANVYSMKLGRLPKFMLPGDTADEEHGGSGVEEGSAVIY